MPLSSDQMLAEIKRGAVEVLLEPELLERLKKGKPLRVKLGFDPTAPDIHLGHTVILNKLRTLQELGHHITFLIGDFTAMIGDPTGKNVTRKPLSNEIIKANALTYQEQLFKILDPKRTEVRFNSEWMSPLSAADLIKLASSQTVARMLERDDFHQRYTARQPIAIHEFLYPLLQAYDSVILKADLELGGADQRFNLLMGRELQKHYGQEPQCVLMMPLIEGLDGVQKMSKSLGNYIGITDPAGEMFGKIMSVSDELMWKYFELLSFRPFDEIKKWRLEVENGNSHPMDVKFALAEEITARFYDQQIAAFAKQEFIERFRNKGVPEEIEEITIFSSEDKMLIAQVLKEAGLVNSTSEGLRLICQGALKIDGEKNIDTKLEIPANKCHTYQIGKRRFAKVRITTQQK
jgi:tyrosyl-tRNA synthetase